MSKFFAFKDSFVGISKSKAKLRENSFALAKLYWNFDAIKYMHTGQTDSSRLNNESHSRPTNSMSYY